MSRKHTSQVDARAETTTVNVSVPIHGRAITSLAHSTLIPAILLLAIIRATSLFEEDAGSTFFIAAAGSLVHCKACARQLIVSAPLKVGQHIYCHGGRLFRRHEKVEMTPINVREPGSSNSGE